MYLKNYVLRIFCGAYNGADRRLYPHDHCGFDSASTHNRAHKKYSRPQKEAMLRKIDRKPKKTLLLPKVAIEDDYFFLHYNHSCGESNAGASYDEELATYQEGRVQQTCDLDKTSEM